MPCAWSARDIEAVTDPLDGNRSILLRRISIPELTIGVVAPALDFARLQTSAVVVISATELHRIRNSAHASVAVVVTTGSTIAHLPMTTVAKAANGTVFASVAGSPSRCVDLNTRCIADSHWILVV